MSEPKPLDCQAPQPSPPPRTTLVGLFAAVGLAGIICAAIVVLATMYVDML